MYTTYTYDMHISIPSYPSLGRILSHAESYKSHTKVILHRGRGGTSRCPGGDSGCVFQVISGVHPLDP